MECMVKDRNRDFCRTTSVTMQMLCANGVQSSTLYHNMLQRRFHVEQDEEKVEPQWREKQTRTIFLPFLSFFLPHHCYLNYLL